MDRIILMEEVLCQRELQRAGLTEADRGAGLARMDLDLKVLFAAAADCIPTNQRFALMQTA
jgi:hypothetical protein